MCYPGGDILSAVVSALITPSASHIIIMPSAAAVFSTCNTIQMCYPGGDILSAVVSALTSPLASHIIIMPSTDAVLSICMQHNRNVLSGGELRWAAVDSLQNIKQTLYLKII